MNEYAVGWDGGGSKTAMQIRDRKGNILYSGESGPLNYNSQNREAVRGTIEELLCQIKEMTGGLPACKCLCVAAAGVSNAEAGKTITDMIRSSGYENRLCIMGDHEAALYGAMGKAEGIVLISGTGSICFGRNSSGEVKRTGGCGHLIDDEGSGYAIGRDILSAAVRSLDGRIKDCMFGELVLKEIGGTKAEDIIAFTYRQNFRKTDIASLSRLLLPALAQQDPQAGIICDRAAAELVKLIGPVAEALHLECGEAAFLGGILTHYQPVREEAEKRLRHQYPLMKLCRPLYDSVTGAALYAAKKMEE